MSTAPADDPMQPDATQVDDTATQVDDTAHAVHADDSAHAAHADDSSHAAHADDTAHAAHADDTAHAAHADDTAHAAHADDTAHAAHADDAANAMKDQLAKDVASWREGRSDGSARGATELSVAVARSIVPPTTARMKRAAPKPQEAKPASTEKKPFGMSYDGTSRQDYIKLMISRGAR